MGLLDRIADYDTIQEMEAARADRYWDAMACATQKRFFAAYYLMGYAIEISLKVACFRFRGVGLDEDLQQERVAAQQMVQARGFRNLHDLGFWAESLVEERVQKGQRLEPGLEHVLRLHSYGAAQNWCEVMRYRCSIPADDEFSQLRQSADWIMGSHPILWS